MEPDIMRPGGSIQELQDICFRLSQENAELRSQNARLGQRIGELEDGYNTLWEHISLLEKDGTSVGPQRREDSILTDSQSLPADQGSEDSQRATRKSHIKEEIVEDKAALQAVFNASNDIPTPTASRLLRSSRGQAKRESYIKPEDTGDEDIKMDIKQDDSMEDVLLPEITNPIPEERQHILNALPEAPLVLPLPDGGLGRQFDRPYISKMLGGSAQASTNMQYFGFKWDSNPWLSLRRLGHGYAFVGLPKGSHDEMIGVEGPTVRHLFIALPGTKRWYYVGIYAFQLTYTTQISTSYLSISEWNGLTTEVRRNYSSFAANRHGISDSRRMEDMFNTGAKACPIRFAQCIGFDHELYGHLLRGEDYNLFKVTRVLQLKRAQSEDTTPVKRLKPDEAATKEAGPSTYAPFKDEEDIKPLLPKNEG